MMTDAAPTRAGLLAALERLGNRLPDPTLLFALAFGVVVVLSHLLAPLELGLVDPRTGGPLIVVDLLSAGDGVRFFGDLVKTFVGFPPLGIVLVAMLGVGVAERAGLVHAALAALMPQPGSAGARFVTPAVIAAAIASHVAADAGFVTVIPLAAALYATLGRHPIAGLAAAFAGVSGGFSATYLPTPLDPLLAGFTEAAGRVVAPTLTVSPLCNFYFTCAASLLVVVTGTWLTDRVIEPRLVATRPYAPIRGDAASAETDGTPTVVIDRRALAAAGLALVVVVVAFLALALPSDAPLRAPDGALASAKSPAIQAVVPLIFVAFLAPGLAYGYASGRFRTHHDVVDAMSHAMGGLSRYLVLAFFAAQFIEAFARSNLGAATAVVVASRLDAVGLPPLVAVLALVVASATLNLLIASASAQWALLAPIVVPVLLTLGVSAEFTQAAYRIGDSVTNVVTPLMPYFPLVVGYARRYDADAGLGTLLSLMTPYAATFAAAWTTLLVAMWTLGLPLGP
jgi:aminobenzoyl-glutamate transport protein